MTVTGEREPRRLALDGLRGVAALVVLVHHALLTEPGVAAVYSPGGETPSGLGTVLASPLLRPFWSGHLAVMTFFVLSGYVLTHSMRAGGGWRGYYASRLLRLYVPVWVVIGVALAVMAVVPRTSEAGSWWINMQSIDPTTRSLLGDLTLAAPSQIDTALWSLRWEILFSVTLPLFLVAGRWLARFGVITAVLLLAAAWLGAVASVDALAYLPVFGLGVLLREWEPGLRRLTGRWHAGWPLVLGGVAWLCAAYSAGPGTVVAAFLLVSVALLGGARLLERSAPQWLGRISYSLYLVHAPLVIVATAAVAPEWGAASMMVTVPASVLLGWAFHVAVEVPSMWVSARAKTAFVESPATWIAQEVTVR